MHNETVREPTCFGGLLARTPAGWRWADGEIEPRMRDVPSRLGDLTCREAFAVSGTFATTTTSAVTPYVPAGRLSVRK